MAVIDSRTFARKDLAVEVERVVDESPDLSWLGEYSEQYEEGAIDREEEGDWSRGEYKYFIPTRPENAEQDYKRMEAYERGDWAMMGIVVTAYDEDGEEVGHASVWGIETDSDEEYLSETEEELIDEALKEAE